jgi:hypothetical protein
MPQVRLTSDATASKLFITGDSKCGGDGMAFMHFYCASHQRKIGGGFDMDLDALRRMRREPVHVYCPLCSMTHRYLLSDAVEATFERRERPAFWMAHQTEAS